MASRSDKVNPFLAMMADPRRGALPGGWSKSPFSGNEPGRQTRGSGLPQQDKEDIAELVSQERRGDAPLTPAQRAINQSLGKYDHAEPEQGESEGEFNAKKSGHLNEAYETARLEKAGLNITASQQPVTSGVTGQGRIPDLTLGEGETKRFVEIKTASIRDPQQMTDIFNADTPNTGFDVNFSSASRNIDPASLKHLVGLEKSGSAVDGRRTVRVRSNSMAEGQFIPPSEMVSRIERRATTAKTVPK